MNRWKQIAKVALVAFGLLLFAAFVMNNLAPSPVKAAKSHCLQKGWTDDQLSLSGFDTSARITGSNGTVQFTANRNNKQTRIHVALRKELFATKWQVVAYEATDLDED